MTEEQEKQQELIGILYQMEKNEEDEEHAILMAYFTDENLMYRKLDEAMNGDDDYIRDDLLRCPLYVMWVPLNVIDSWTFADTMTGDYGAEEIDMKKRYPKQYMEYNSDSIRGEIQYHKNAIVDLERKLTE